MKKDYVDNLKPKRRKDARKIGRMIARGENSKDIEKKWLRLIGRLDSSLSIKAINSLVLWVLREAYRADLADLKWYFDRVQFYNEQKRLIREYFAGLKAASGEAKKTSQISGQELEIPPDSDEELLDSLLEAWEKQLDTEVSDAAQLAYLDLQNALQKQQQTLQVMSSIMKMMYDTALSSIQKMGG